MRAIKILKNYTTPIIITIVATGTLLYDAYYHLLLSVRNNFTENREQLTTYDCLTCNVVESILYNNFTSSAAQFIHENGIEFSKEGTREPEAKTKLGSFI